jgi:transposase InsO family protein
VPVILQLKAARNWSQQQTAQRFLVTSETIASWLQHIDEEGPKALVQLAEPVNKFPDLVRVMVQLLKTLCPMLGKVKIAQTLARAGLHWGVTTVGRILKEKPAHQPTAAQAPEAKQRGITSKYPNHVWLADLTTLPIDSGFWASWLPCSLPQYWPFCWWIGVLMDHYSRRIMGTTLFGREPSSQAMRAFLGRAMHAANARPRRLITDRGPQFDCQKYKRWCRRKGIKPRFGALGQHGSIAVTERLILTLKQNLAWIPLIPLRRRVFLRQILELAAWYHRHRPHMSLDGRTPEEVYCR